MSEAIDNRMRQPRTAHSRRQLGLMPSALRTAIAALALVACSGGPRPVPTSAPLPCGPGYTMARGSLERNGEKADACLADRYDDVEQLWGHCAAQGGLRLILQENGRRQWGCYQNLLRE